MKEEVLLLHKLKQGKVEAFQEVFKTFHADVCNYIYSIILDEDESKDIAQQAFIKLWEKRDTFHTFDKIAGVKAYIFKSAYNISMNRFKHNSVRERYENDERYILQSQFVDDFDNTFDIELGDEIKKAVESLPEKNKEVFQLRFFRGFDTQEVSNELNISKRTVETHVSKSFRLLRSKLSHLLTLLLFVAFFI